MANRTEKQKIEHTRGGTTTRDALDLGAQMSPARPGEGPQGPEDALEADTRGDYSGKRGSGESYAATVTGYREDGSPIIEMVRQK